MRLFITLLLGCLVWQPALAARADREPAQTGAEAGGKQQNAPNQAETTEALQSALNWLTGVKSRRLAPNSIRR